MTVDGRPLHAGTGTGTGTGTTRVPGLRVTAPWDDGIVPAEPEPRHFRGRWCLVARTGDCARKAGSFTLVSQDGVEGPCRLVEGNLEEPFGDSSRWSGAARVDAAAVPGVVRPERAGPEGDRLCVRRRKRSRREPSARAPSHRAGRRRWLS
ncbi:hypothetical protein GCM10010238_39750 [Streptomyces griseoviridis]|uniref:Uncharacterized protein n=1 Tax=Streptomyces griseoviridis TaxID=45398 RepID=A0A918GM23_STRGD|nr:hypothetical protein GCM10010238_39750 [Streptomyces niveoruber]